jgi:hypothetical protein
MVVFLKKDKKHDDNNRMMNLKAFNQLVILVKIAIINDIKA